MAQYRGRTYEARFAPEIASPYGPWKMQGLPGLILSVRTLDGYFSSDAVKLINNTKKHAITNPYAALSVRTLQEFKKDLREHYLFLAKNAAAKNPDGGTYKINFFGDQLEDFDIDAVDFEY